MKTNKLALGVFAAAAVGAAALALYPRAPAVAAASASTSLTGEQLCRKDLVAMVQFRDPASVRINSVQPNPDRAGRYFLSVSAKNAYGGYGAPFTCSCGTDVSAGVTLDMHCDSTSGA